jgi:hypothetical protein
VKNLYDLSRVEEVKQRLLRLRPDSRRLWGKMEVAQMMAHCSAALEMATGLIRPPRLLVGRLIGWAIKPLVLRDEEPMRRNAPTAKALLAAPDCDFAVEQKRLRELIDCFAAAGPAGCTSHPHCIFGRLTPQQWSVLMYKHLDHHLRQFGV